MKTVKILMLLCMISTFAGAQDTTKYNFSFNHLALSVTDLNRAAEFYMKVFQFKEITNRTAMPGIRWIAMGEGKELHLISTLKEPVTTNKAVHLSLATRHIDAFEMRLVALKIPYSDWPGKPNAVNVRADGVKQIYFQDPDGYWIEVNNGYAK